MLNPDFCATVLEEQHMTSHHRTLALSALLLGLSTPSLSTWAADSAQTQIAGWTSTAKASDTAFTASAERGKAFYLRTAGTNAEMVSCAACHTSNPANSGKHAVTGKTIAPMSPLVNAERFTDAAKTEKWFKRNCNDVLARVCTPAEKADFVSYLLSVK
jgi:mono/diheme cytochrome c family protein